MSHASEQPEKIKTLLIGSKLDMATEIETCLASYCAEIEFLGWAKTGQEGVDKLRNLDPHVILLDIATPDMLAEEVISHIREYSESVKIITMSLSNNPSWIIKVIEAGADDYVSQPVLSDDLYNRINKLYHRTGMSLREQLAKRKASS